MTNEEFIRKAQAMGGQSSVVLVIPKKICQTLEISPGDYIKMTLEGKTIRVTKVKWIEK